jgi:hypothetical protein
VSITRARTKSVVCLPAPLLEASPGVLEVPEAAKGLAFMRGLVQAVEAQAAPQVFALEGGVCARVLRASRTTPCPNDRVNRDRAGDRVP